MENLRQVNFEPGCIGAEDVVLDAKIQREGRQPFIDPSNVAATSTTTIQTLRRSRCGTTAMRMVANKRWPEIATWSHTAIGFFPWLTALSIIALIAGAATGVRQIIHGSHSRVIGRCLDSQFMERLV